MKYLSACITALAIFLILAPVKNGHCAPPIENSGKFIERTSGNSASQVDTQRQNDYEITGITADELISHVMTVARDNNLILKWDIKWKYMVQEAPNTNICFPRVFSAYPNIHKPAIRLVWVDAALATEDLRRKWQRYLNALDEHNQGHVDIARLAVKTINATIRNNLSAKNCDQLRKDIDAKVNEIIQGYRQMDAEYDHATNNDELHVGPDVYMLK